MAVTPRPPRPCPQIKKLCLTERQERTSAGVAAAKAGQPHLPRALETRSGLTPEMRMASAIMVGRSRAVWLRAEMVDDGSCCPAGRTHAGRAHGALLLVDWPHTQAAAVA